MYELLARKGQLDEKKRQVVEVYLEGLSAYKTRNFSTACARFSEAVDSGSIGRPFTGVLGTIDSTIGRLPRLLDWDGVYEMTSK